jgi:ferredoxin-NADP reductase
MQKIKLLSKKEIAEGTMEFEFERPDGFTYLAGQTIDLTLIDPGETDAEGNTRTFSLVSAPHETTLRIATRMRDTAFKRTIKSMEEGTSVSVDGPFGSFLLHENIERPAVFLSGGIGITPFHSMISDASFRSLPHTLCLFYSNRRPEDAAYLDEFQNIEKANSKFKVCECRNACTACSNGNPHFLPSGTPGDGDCNARNAEWNGCRQRRYPI